jgi:hypothetical protein
MTSVGRRRKRKTGKADPGRLAWRESPVGSASDSNIWPIRSNDVNPDEIRKIEAYMRKKFELDRIVVKARPRKDDSAEVYIGDEFIGVIFRDDEDEDLSWNFQMAILEFDLEDI